MSKIAIDLKTLFTDTSFRSPGKGEILSELNKRIDYSDYDLSNILAGRAYEVNTTTSFDIAALTGYKVEDVALQSIRLAVVHIVKTEETVTGTYAVASTPLGITSGTVTVTSDAQVAALNIGDVIRSFIFFSATGINGGSGADLTVTLGSPVGFKAQVLIVGDIAD